MKTLRRTEGITLTEAMIATGIAVLLVLLSAEGFVSAATRSQGKAAATEVAAMLRNAHHAAMVSRQPIQVVFDPAGIVEAGNGAASSARRYDLRLQNVKLVSMTGAPVVTFYPSGRSASGTTITLANARGDQWRITVGLTGRVVLH